jgi:polysaccharide deacetylase family protein (PEP-CTERM system associated)
VTPSGETPATLNAMTVDVEDYFHVSVFDGVVPRSRWETLESRVERNTERLLEIFAETGVKATFFVLGWVAERHPGLVRRIAAQGHEVASHGFAHRLVYDLTPAMFRDDVRRSKACSKTAAGRPVEGYRAPSYSVTPALALGARHPDRRGVTATTRASSRSITIATGSRCRRGTRTG